MLILLILLAIGIVLWIAYKVGNKIADNVENKLNDKFENDLTSIKEKYVAKKLADEEFAKKRANSLDANDPIFDRMEVIEFKRFREPYVKREDREPQVELTYSNLSDSDGDRITYSSSPKEIAVSDDHFDSSSDSDSSGSDCGSFSSDD